MVMLYPPGTPYTVMRNSNGSFFAVPSNRNEEGVATDYTGAPDNKEVGQPAVEGVATSTGEDSGFGLYHWCMDNANPDPANSEAQQETGAKSE